MIDILPLLALAGSVTASFVSNVNYRSPSHHHPSLGISTRKVAARNIPNAAWKPSQLNFTHGVASGDPYDDTVILWYICSISICLHSLTCIRTRAAPFIDNDASNITVSGYVPLYSHETQDYVRASKAPVCVEYKVAKEIGMTNIVDHGTVYTSSDIDFTVKVEAKNLKAYTNYCESGVPIHSQDVG